MKRVLQMSLVASLAGAATVAQAATVYFSSMGNSSGGPSYSDQGLTFTTAPGFVRPARNYFTLVNGYPATITITATPGGAFSVFDFISEQFEAPNGAIPPETVTFTGTKFDGSVVT